jgi:hypothetical protein
MPAILTRYHGPTNTRGSRISAQTADTGTCRRVTVAYRHERSSFENHTAAARELAEQLGYDDTRWHSAATDKGYWFVAEMHQPAFAIDRDDNR